MLKLEFIHDSRVLRVSGRIEAANLDELKRQMQIHPSPLALELSNVTLVDAESVSFLAAVEAAGLELRNCPLFIREWIRSTHTSLVK